MPVIRVSDELFSRLEAYAVGFDTPSAVIERLLNEHENKTINTETCKPINAVTTENQPNSTIYGEQMTTSSKNEIAKIHDELFQFLLDYKEKYPDFYFMPRQKGARLKKGYWFLGDENYLAIGFYTGRDTNRTANITFQVYLSDVHLKRLNRKQIPTSVIQLSNVPDSSGWLSKKPVIEKIKEKLGGFEVDYTTTDGIERRWNRYYDSKDYLKCLEEFLTKDKPLIDDIIRKAENSEIGLLDKKKSEDKINNIKLLRKTKIDKLMA